MIVASKAVRNIYKYVLVGGSALLGALVLTRYVSAELEGNIVASEPLMFGQCVEGACLTDTEAIAYVTFKNVGGAYRENIVGISVDDVMVKEQSIGLNPGTGFTMAYTFTISAGTNNICGVVK
jgi:hypothetical protein